MKWLTILVIPAILLAGLALVGLSDTAICAADANSPDNELTISQTQASNSSASDEIYGLRIENISKGGADFYWSTSIETKGSIEYAYTKLALQYNPQSSGSQQSVLITAVPVRVKSESGYFKTHHIRLDDLDMYYAPIVQYTIRSEIFGGDIDIAPISGEFVLVDTQVLRWWQTSYFVVSLAVISVLGFILTIRKYVQSRKAKRGAAPLD